MAGDWYVGVDIGGTKSRRRARRSRRPGPPPGNRRHCACRRQRRPRHAAGLVRSVAGDAAIAAVGIGSPGVVDAASGGVKFATSVVRLWTGVRVRDELELRLGKPVAVDNDVRAMAFGEARCGAGRGHADALRASIGTGHRRRAVP